MLSFYAEKIKVALLDSKQLSPFFFRSPEKKLFLSSHWKLYCRNCRFQPKKINIYLTKVYTRCMKSPIFLKNIITINPKFGTREIRKSAKKNKRKECFETGVRLNPLGDLHRPHKTLWISGRVPQWPTHSSLFLRRCKNLLNSFIERKIFLWPDYEIGSRNGLWIITFNPGLNRTADV